MCSSDLRSFGESIADIFVDTQAQHRINPTIDTGTGVKAIGKDFGNGGQILGGRRTNMELGGTARLWNHFLLVLF